MNALPSPERREFASVPPRDYVGDRFLPLKEVMLATGASRSSIYSWMNDGSFPKPIRIGMRRVCWRASAIKVWMHKREALSN